MGTPVIVSKKEFDNIIERLPHLQTPTTRNQYIYRVALRAINRPMSEIPLCSGLIVFDKKVINIIEMVYAHIERKHFCSTVINILELYLNRRRLVGK